MSKKIVGVCSVAAVIALVVNFYPVSTSKKGLEIIGNAEGCRTQPYQCPSDVLTVGIGSTEYSGQKIENKVYSLDEIAKRWQADLLQAENCVNRYANGKAMTQGAFDALTSLTFNVGCTTLKNSTLFRLARQGYSPKMCDEFTRWVYANGEKLPGLVKRREQERKLCLSHY